MAAIGARGAGALHDVPYAEPYTKAAWKVRKAWGHELEALYSEASALRDLTSRAHLFSHQIAGVYAYAHQATAPDPEKPITLECAEAAKAVCQTVITHARFLLTEGDAPALTQGRQQDASDRGKVLQQVEKIRHAKKGRTVKSIYNSVKGRDGQGLAFGTSSAPYAEEFGTVRVFDYAIIPIPTLPEWGLILLTLSLVAIATWQLAHVPSMATGVSGTVMGSGGSWLTSMLLGQVAATVGLGFYTVLVGPLVAHDGIGAFLAGVLLAVIVEGYRRTRC